MKESVAFLITLLLISEISLAQEDTCSSISERKTSIGILPSIYYTPETSLSLGAFINFNFFADTNCRKSNTRLFFDYTLNRQFIVDLPWQVYAPGEQYIFFGKLELKRNSEYFYGLSNYDPNPDKGFYWYNWFYLTSKNLKKIRKNLFAGVELRVQQLSDFEALVNPEIFDKPEISGTNGYFVHGTGPTIIFDNRDNILCSEKGSYLEISNVFFFKGISAYSFSNLVIDYRKYLCLNNNFNLAFQSLINATVGNAPFRELPALGGPYLMRGYYLGRFRDRNLYNFQAEIRYSITERLKFVLFGGAGNVASSLVKISQITPQFSGGPGLRFKIKKSEKSNVRLDVGFNREGHGIYLYFSEAF